MPPANSPTGPNLSSRPLTPLSYLDASVPDLASTLVTGTGPHDDSTQAVAADTSNADFLRHSFTTLEDAERPETTETAEAAESAPVNPSDSTGRQSVGSDDALRRARLQMILARLNSLHQATASSHSTRQSGERPQLQERQVFYERVPRETSDERIRSPNGRHATGQPTSDYGTPHFTQHSAAMASLNRQEARLLRWAAETRQPPGSSSPSATERMLRQLMERERSGLSEEEERARNTGWLEPDAEEQRTETAPESGEHWLLPPPAGNSRGGRRRVIWRRGAVRGEQQCSGGGSSGSPSRSKMETALNYLDELRYHSQEDGTFTPVPDPSLAAKDVFAEKHDDFVTRMADVPRLPATSWLMPGTVFDGHQQATGENTSTIRTGAAPARPMVVEQINPHYTGDVAGHSVSSQSSSSVSTTGDRWPVRVTLHAVDHDRMTIQGTMEAFDVPHHGAKRQRVGRKGSPITTYLEGQIIDLHTHTFLTPRIDKKRRQQDNASVSFDLDIVFPAASAQADVKHWLRLPPFDAITRGEQWCVGDPDGLDAAEIRTILQQTKDHQGEEAAMRVLLSRQALTYLSRHYVFMRWKERCFVPSSTASQRNGHGRHTTRHSDDKEIGSFEGSQQQHIGLTIRGFYYVSLRRADGEVNGIYYDPFNGDTSSTSDSPDWLQQHAGSMVGEAGPLQLLQLKGHGGRTWPAVEMR